MERKVCKDCRETKPLTEFYPHRPGKYGPYCKRCHHVRSAASKKRLAERRELDAEAGKRLATPERFWSLVEKTESGCWYWRGAAHRDRASRGGRFWIGSKEVSARQYSWEQAYGSLPHGHYIWLTCNEALCVRPDHLRGAPKASSMRDDVKRCSRCHLWKPLDQYSPDVNTRSAHRLFNYCKTCASEYMRTGDFHCKDTAYRLQLKYGLTEEAYRELRESHAGKCAICGGNGGKQGLGIDHSHSTGVVRGLLCSSCNAAIGMLRDDIFLMHRAIDYVEKWDAIIASMQAQLPLIAG